MSQRLLVVEDDDSIRRVLRDNLEFEGFEVKCVADGNAALTAIRSFAPDLVLLDLMLPGLDGFEICRSITEGSLKTPVIILSARGQESDKILGLRLGADDYVTKPFSLEELLARINAVMRRTNVAPERLELGDLTIDFSAMRATKGKRTLLLTPREFEVLRLLWIRRGKVVTREQLLRTIWGYSDVPATRSVDYFIARLRSKIESNPHDPKYLQTVYGDGYRLL